MPLQKHLLKLIFVCRKERRRRKASVCPTGVCILPMVCVSVQWV